MGSALLNTTDEPELAKHAGLAAKVPRHEVAAQQRQPASAASAEALRSQVAERLEAHRRRRGGTAVQAGRVEVPARSPNTRSARIAAAVAERYAHTQSYRAFLAAEAERAIQQARAAAEVAAMNAQAVAVAQQRLLDAFDESARRKAQEEEAMAAAVIQPAAPRSATAKVEASRPVELHLWPELDPEGELQRPVEEPAPRVRRPAVQQVPAPEAGGGATQAGLTVRLYEDGSSAALADLELARQMPGPGQANRRDGSSGDRDYSYQAEASALDEEIAFRQAPVFEEPAGPATVLPANLIEFPRQLVASRKARPRYAEGPLRYESETAPLDGQLRIFEVDAEQISTRPEAETDGTPATQWTSIWLDTPAQGRKAVDPVSAHAMNAEAEELLLACAPEVPAVRAASMARRVLAGSVNSGIVLAGVVTFVAGFVLTVNGPVAWPADVPTFAAVRMAAASIAAQTGLQVSQVATIAAAAFGFLLLAYEALFLWFAGATPGMRVARIGLCTFTDGNPTRKALRRRLGAMLLSAFPLGLGFAWAALDEERLTWHDRITKMYLREY